MESAPLLLGYDWQHPLATLPIILLVFLIWIATGYRRCPPGKIMVVYGKQGLKCLHGGGTLVWRLHQDYALLDLAPHELEAIRTQGATADGRHVSLMVMATVAIGTEPDLMERAAIRLLDLPRKEIAAMARELLTGALAEEVPLHTLPSAAELGSPLDTALHNLGLHLTRLDVTDVSVSVPTE